MISYTEKKPVFSESIQITENTDPAFADNINAAPKQLLQNTMVNKKQIEALGKEKADAETHDQDIKNINRTIESILDSLVDLVYPIGSIYTSVVNVSPESIIGGIWTPIKDTFLLCAGDEYKAGSIGGSSTKNIEVNNLPAHSHKYTPGGNVSSTFTGDSQEHKHSIKEHSHYFTVNTSANDGAHSHRISMITPNSDGEYTTDHVLFGRTEGIQYINSKPLHGTDETLPNGVHTHTYSGNTESSSGARNTLDSSITPSGTVSSSFTGSKAGTENTGSGEALNIMPPYRTVYAWERTA